MKGRMRLKDEIRLTGKPKARVFQRRKHRRHRVVSGIRWRILRGDPYRRRAVWGLALLHCRRPILPFLPTPSVLPGLPTWQRPAALHLCRRNLSGCLLTLRNRRQNQAKLEPNQERKHLRLGRSGCPQDSVKPTAVYRSSQNAFSLQHDTTVAPLNVDQLTTLPWPDILALPNPIFSMPFNTLERSSKHLTIGLNRSIVRKI